MPRQELVVLDGEELVGTLTRVSGAISFRYDESWRRRQGATPLSVSMPLELPEHGHDVVEAWLWGVLPDNDRLS